MSNHPKILAVIPARGGSKGIPGKNIRDLNGKPLIAYAIEAALGASDILYKTVVSTDCEDIKAVAEKYGAEVPFIRPAEFATDTATSLSVMQHAVKTIEEMDGTTIDWTMLIQPTNPLILISDIKNAVQAIDNKCTSIVSAKDATDCHPLKILTQTQDGSLKYYSDQAPDNVRRQDLPPVYLRNGSIYMTRRDTLMTQNTLYGDHILPYIMPPERSIDIDTEFDLKLAEFILKSNAS
jgi:CMP-N-acetylneuraminic acid synthetase